MAIQSTDLQSPLPKYSAAGAPWESLTFVRRLGKGRFGNVHYYKHEKQALAIKILSTKVPFKIAQDELLILDFIASLEPHENITRYYGRIKSASSFAFAFELLETGDLLDVVKRRPLKPSNIRDITLDIAGGLEFLHHNRIIHNDLKLENVLLTATLRAKITDFGLAQRVPDAGSYRATQLAHIKISYGTPAYLPPELFQSRIKTLVSEWWALGVLFYALCNLQFPFSCNKFDGEETSSRIVKRLFKPPLPRMNVETAEVVDGLLELDMHKRVCSLEQLKEYRYFKS